MLIVASVVAMNLAAVTRTYGQAAAEVIGPTGEIPRDHYKTWSLFLVCNPEWLSSDRSSDVYFLYKQLKSFGRSIGDDNLAVWFWNRKVSGPADAADSVDAERSARFCKAFSLAPSSSPYLVVTSSYPEPSSRPKDLAVYELANMSPGQMNKLLAKLTDQLLLQERVTPDTSNEPLEARWIRLLAASQRVINDFGCAWSFRIQTGVLNADLRSCQNR